MKKNLNDDNCQHCNKKMLSMQGVRTEIEGNQVLLCGPCWNKFVSEFMGANFETIELKPITLRDCRGKAHVFHILTHIVPSGLAIKAREMIDQGQMGYEFSVVGPHGCNQSDLILDLYEKIKRGLSKKYLKKNRVPIEIQDDRVVGRIEWDEDYGGEIPKLVIDGRVVTWAQLGKMLMSFEGWQFKLEMIDPAGEAVDER